MSLKRVYVAGCNGMVGNAICRHLIKNESVHLVTTTRSDLDLTNQLQVQDFFQGEDVDQIYLVAAKVGGIHANNEFPAEFIYENLMIEANVINSAHKAKIQNLLFLGSSCIYPKFTKQPIKEQSLLTGVLENTNEPYAIAKIAGIKLCESYNRQYGRDYRCIMPSNLYGPEDNFHPSNSHVIPALIQRFHKAKLNKLKEVVVWGTGMPKREFLHVDDLARGAIHIMNLDLKTYSKYSKPMMSHINIGSGHDCTIKNLTETIAKIVGFNGLVSWDKTKPDGTPRKLLDISLIKKIGWKPTIELEEGLKDTYQWYLENLDKLRIKS